MVRLQVVPLQFISMVVHPRIGILITLTMMSTSFFFIGGVVRQPALALTFQFNTVDGKGSFPSLLPCIF